LTLSARTATIAPVPALEVVSFVDEGLGHSSYLVDVGDGAALVVDPTRVMAAERDRAAKDGTRLAFTADTHTHADYVSGSPILASSGATFFAPEAARLEHRHRPLSGGDDVAVGRFVLRALPTPGHTPDHLAYLLLDDGMPLALFSGGSLMVGTAGRTDLLGPEHTTELAHAQYRTLRVLMALPDDLAVYPTHGAGSFCSAPGASDRTTTIGHERATNPLLQIEDEDVFVERLVGSFGSLPPYFRRLPGVNRTGAPAPASELLRLTVEEVQRLVAGGATVVDTRPIAAFASGHVAGAVSDALRPVFGGWLAWLVDPTSPVVFVVDDAADVGEVVRQAANVGCDNLAGVLDGGMHVWGEAGLPVATLPLVDAHATDGAFVDVRQREEFVVGHVPGACSVELGEIGNARLPAGPLTIMCGHGERAMTAASLLARAGRADVRVLAGGPDDWSGATHVALQRDA
jgi:glyoxylase-like metal-dependent hydrolase (beta-lactamase superfamily II)/rhodanese-related sulfurtransferase